MCLYHDSSHFLFIPRRKSYPILIVISRVNQSLEITKPKELKKEKTNDECSMNYIGEQGDGPPRCYGLMLAPRVAIIPLKSVLPIGAYL